MIKILTIADPHLTRPGKTIIGLDPARRLQNVLARAARDHDDADRLIILGDLAHWGGPLEYAALKSCLAGAPWPVHYMIGNHDNREMFQAAFPDAAKTAHGHVQEVIDLPGWRLITLDSHDETYSAPAASGILCGDRMAWLKAARQGAGDRRVVIFIHHPPVRTFFGGMDRIGLRNGAELLALLAEYPAVVQIIGGHIHRTISGTAGGLAFTVLKSTCHQIPLELGDSSQKAATDEPPAFGILLLHADGITVHSEDVFDADAPAQARA